jgi:hypothetical protein
LDPATIKLILTLLPLAENLIFNIGGKLIELNTEELTREDMLKALSESRSDNWPDLKFVSAAKPTK